MPQFTDFLNLLSEIAAYNSSYYGRLFEICLENIDRPIGVEYCYLTPNRPVIHTCFTYPILNMDDFSALYGPLGCIDSTQKVKGNSLHAE